MSQGNKRVLTFALLIAVFLTGCLGGGWSDTGFLTVEMEGGVSTAVTWELFLSNNSGRALFLPLGGSPRIGVRLPTDNWYLWGFARDASGRVVAVSRETVVRGGQATKLRLLLEPQSGEPTQPRVKDLRWETVDGVTCLSWEVEGEAGAWATQGVWQIFRSRSDGILWEKIGQVVSSRTEFEDTLGKLGVFAYGIRYVDDPRTLSYPGPFVTGSGPVLGGIEVSWEFQHYFPPVNLRYFSVQAVQESPSQPEFADLVAHFTSSRAFAERHQLLDAVGLEVKREIPDLLAVLVEPRRDSELSLEEWSTYAGPHFYLEPNWIVRADSVATAPALSAPWYLSYIRVPQAQTITSGSQNVRIAVVDTGLNRNVLPSTVKVLAGYNFVHNNLDTRDDNVTADFSYHGTYVAKLISEVAPVVSVQPIKVLGASGSGTVLDVAEGLLYAAGIHSHLTNPTPAHIINLSLGMPGQSDTLRDAVERVASQTNVVMIAASGNSNSGDRRGVVFPAAYPEVLAVGAVVANSGTLERAIYSHYGEELDLVAPPGGESGTSFSTALVSGVTGLMLAKGIYSDQVKSILTTTAMDLGASRWDEQYGYGLVNAEWAVRNIAGFSLVVRKNDSPEIVWEQKVPLEGGRVLIDLPSGEYVVEGRLDDYYAQSRVVRVIGGYGEAVHLILEERKQ